MTNPSNTRNVGSPHSAQRAIFVSDLLVDMRTAGVRIAGGTRTDLEETDEETLQLLARFVAAWPGARARIA